MRIVFTSFTNSCLISNLSSTQMLIFDFTQAMDFYMDRSLFEKLKVANP